ncbi:hypothetical protein E0D86_04595 [Pseudomonas sp. IC_126]|uniref:hypothetical protein n=1 Tax=Pseudomonas sp. IC_126 TaxID=2547400 RepID=UPI00103BE46B|nr:hypothetical protein [Pseudomonas sp. IC_126]TCD24483.1 hypothetical protein E0D86_04595 [Pseudomonas sp. IC_126]
MPLIVTNDLKFSFGDQKLPYSVDDFWNWAFSNITTPVIRGVMLEFILARYLMDRVDDIVLERVLDLTCQKPHRGQLTKSLEPVYACQPHGDVFDLQLTWGVTIEIKSTSNRANWRLYKTCRWNSVQNKNKAEKIFPAQYYILAVIEKDPNVSVIDVNLKDVEFYLCSGRTLDRHVSPSRKSVGYKKFSNLSIRCTFSDLVNTLYHLQRQEHERVRLLLAPGWKLPLPASFELKPLAVEASDTVTAIWHQDGDDTLLNATPIDVPWVEGVTPDWRDWEAAGFKYDPQVEVSPCIAGQPT